jgi:hypothetical protein
MRSSLSTAEGASQNHAVSGERQHPFELRSLAATKPDVLTALGRIFAEEVERVTKRLAGVAGAETGSISFPQRFGGSLNLHVHFHLLAVDAVFDKHGEGVCIHEAPPPASFLSLNVSRQHRRSAHRRNSFVAGLGAPYSSRFPGRMLIPHAPASVHGSGLHHHVSGGALRGCGPVRPGFLARLGFAEGARVGNRRSLLVLVALRDLSRNWSAP